MTKLTARELVAIVLGGHSSNDECHRLLASRVEKVLELHRPMNYGDGVGMCFACHTMSPCPTIRKLNGEE